MIKKSLVPVAALFLLTVSSLGAEQADISRLTKNNRAVKVFVKDITNESGETEIMAADFKKVLEDSLLKRKAVKFELVKSPDASDLQISGVIKKYLYSKTDPITTFASPSGLLLDAVTTENYAEMSVNFTVVETKSGKTIWNGMVMDFIKHTMTPEESIPKVYDKVARTFLWKCFGKPSAFARDAIHSR